MTQMVHEPQPAPWVPDDSTFGARLVLLRQRMGWGNIAEAARQCGIPIDSWRNWEEGRSPRNEGEIAKQISKRTGCDVQWLVLGPSRAHLQTRMDATLWERGSRHNRHEPSAVPSQRTVTIDPPLAGLPATRPVTATRPMRQQLPAVALPAMAR